MSITVGQRWISQAESSLGLGIVVATSGRRITMSFPAVEEERIYATDNQALSRVRYREGDDVTTKDDIEMRVLDVEEQGGLLLYKVIDSEQAIHIIPELELSCYVHFSTPRQRLLNGQLDRAPLYQTRIATLYHHANLSASSVRGLLGSRTSLLPHQIYIAAEVASRHAPRVLLADEVGLGKTIEAGMIVHQQLLVGRANRVLIVTPDSLQHQWLVEMLRRFNLHFSLFSEERLEALAEDESGNPFDSEQLILCAQSLLSGNPRYLEAACASDWDLVVVDEAHHLHWTEQSASDDYLSIERLAGGECGLLLLTATPEQAGPEGHFARLRLLDPARFHDLQAFRDEQHNYAQVNRLARQLLAEQVVTPELEPLLVQLLGNNLPTLDAPQTGEHPATTAHDSGVNTYSIDAILRQLLDRHGTSRVMFRNTRAAIPDFPRRQLFTYPLPAPDLYSPTENASTTVAIPLSLHPESAFADEQWITCDPRVEWLQDFLKQQRPAKILVICARASTALALEYQLHMRAGIRCTAFHEGLTLVERDRAAAWFAETDNGAQALICSEIGSEGRNFQFAHHLILFDLPLDPDLLEQRIGRLDRIGQTETISIHVPFLEYSAQHTLLRWYHEGMDVFTRSCSAGYAILEQFHDSLTTQLLSHDSSKLSELIDATRQYTEATRAAMQQGRDPLLELNSCNPGVAAKHIDAIQESEDNDHFIAYLEQLLDECGVDHDVHSTYARILRPSEHMLFDTIPGLKDEGVTITVDRQQALAREDMEFLSWEHPMVAETMAMLLASESGSTTLGSISLRGLPRGTVLLEAIYSLDCLGAKNLQLERYLPAAPVRWLLNREGKDLAEVISHDQLNQLAQKVKRITGQAIINRARGELEPMLDRAEQLSTEALPKLIDEARSKARRELGAELLRLRELQIINPNIRATEINFLEQRIDECSEQLGRATLQPQGLRVLINT